MSKQNAMPRSLAGTMILALAMGCTETPAAPDPGAGENVQEFLTGLPSWSEFTADVNAPDQPPAPTGEAADTTMEVAAFEEYGDSGEVVVQPEVTYQCVSTPHSITKNPEKIVMYSPDASVLWPGALVQGQSRKALGSLLPLPIEERAPLRITIPDFASSDNTRTVDTPNEGTMCAARGEIVGNATASGLQSPSSIDFKMSTHHSERFQALSASLSGAYLGFSARATGDFSREGRETTVTANFIQKMFTVIVNAPQTPDAFFSADFTDAKLQQQVDQGRMGPSNIPIYVSEIVYGRLLTFSMTSTASETDIRATLQAAYEGIGVSAELALSARQKKILERSKLAVTSVGGDGTATLSVIREGNLGAYFTDNPPLSSAAPISFTFRNLGDGSIAGVTESTNYDIRQCDAIPASPGTFTYLPKQEANAPFSGAVQTLTGDVDGDGKTDMIWNQLQGTTNQLFVGISAGDGTFSFTSPFVHPATAPSEGWGNFTVSVSELNGDGFADLVWNHLGTENKTYVGYGNGDGTFATPSVRIHPLTPWSSYTIATGDAMGPSGSADGRDDLLWLRRVSGSLFMHSARSDASSVLVNQTGQLLSSATGWQLYDMHTGDVDGDADTDVILNITSGASNRTYAARSDGDGTWTLSGLSDNTTHTSWSGFATLVADVDASGKDGIIFADTTNLGVSRVSVGSWNGTGFTFGPIQSTTFDNQGVLVPFDVEVLDVEGDGDADIVWNLRTGLDNLIYISRGQGGGTFDFGVARVRHPDSDESNWSQYRMFTGDVNGDGRDDIIWSWPAQTNRIYTAIGKN